MVNILKDKDIGASRGLRLRQKKERSSTGVVTRKQGNRLRIRRSHEKVWTADLIWFMYFSEVSYVPQQRKGISKKKKKSERESLNYHNFPKHETQVTFNLSTGQKKRKEKTKQNSNKNITFLLFVKFSQR